MRKIKYLNTSFAKFTSIMSVILTGFFAFSYLYDFVNVGIPNQRELSINHYTISSPWYYKTVDLFSTVHFVIGIISLLLISLCVMSLIKNRKKAFYLSSTLLMLLAILISFTAVT